MDDVCCCACFTAVSSYLMSPYQKDKAVHGNTVWEKPCKSHNWQNTWYLPQNYTYPFVESLCKDLPVIRPPYELSIQLCGGIPPHGEFTPCQKQRIFHWPRAEWVFQNCLARLLTVSFKILLMFSGSLVCLKSSCQWCLQCLSPLRSSDPKMVNCVPWSDIYSLRFSSWLITVKREVRYSSGCNLWH